MTTVITIISIFALILLHELGHFLVAKKFDVRVDEFGLGLPPRAYGKKIGETIYSINWLPLGGFVKMHGENERADDERSFSAKPVYQRALIVFAGVAAFFVIAFFIFTTLSFYGVYRVPGDEREKGFYAHMEVDATMVMEGSPGEEAGILNGDTILQINGENVKSASRAIAIIRAHGGEEIDITVRRDSQLLSLTAVPHKEASREAGSLGVVMNERLPAYYAPLVGATMTYDMTAGVLGGIATMITGLFSPDGLPDDMEVAGIVGIISIGADVYERGFVDYLYFMGVITVSLAVLNLLPIPALDGGRLVFLLAEKIKGKPVSENIEQILIGTSFVLLIILMIVVTYGDIIRLAS